LSSVAKVTALDTNAEHAKAISTQGLRVIGKNPRTARIAATSDPTSLKNTAFAAIIFLTKSKATAAAVEQLRTTFVGNPALVTLQNGMGNAEALLAVPDAIVLRGVTMNAGRYVEPGCVESLIEGKTWLGPARGSVENVKPLADLLNEGGMETEIVTDPMGAVWSKFVFNCVMNPLGALMMGDNAARHNSPAMRALIDDMAANAWPWSRRWAGVSRFRPWSMRTKSAPARFRCRRMPARRLSTSRAAARPKSMN
jgi:2-dehydropantoate 2-reductase